MDYTKWDARQEARFYNSRAYKAAEVLLHYSLNCCNLLTVVHKETPLSHGELLFFTCFLRLEVAILRLW